MGIKHNNLTVQDTIPAKHINIDTLSQSKLNLNIERNTIEMVSLRTFTSDSVRAKKIRTVRPIIKTEALIPENDSIEHPSFNVLTNNYSFPENPSFFDQLNFTPFNPELKNEILEQKHVKKPALKTKDNITTIKEITSTNLVTKPAKTDTIGFESTDWMLGIIIFSLILFSWIRVGFSRYFHNAIQASINYFTARRIFEEGNVTRSRVFYFMNLLFFVNLALFVTQFLEYHHTTIFNMHGIVLFLLSLLTIILLYSGKSLFLYLFDFLFLTRSAFTSYVFTVFIYNKIVGFLLLPIISILPFVPSHITPWLFVTGGLIVVILYIFRVFKGVQLCFKNRLSIFYLILYLCALEILPVSILLKVAFSYL